MPSNAPPKPPPSRPRSRGGLDLRLRALVGEVGALLGEAVRTAAGETVYDAIERVRRATVSYRDADTPAGRSRALSRARKILRALQPGQRADLAQAYTIYLALVNACENAYRTHRLRRRARPATEELASRANLVYVLTAHPTESRSPECIQLLRRVQNHLTDALSRDRPLDPDLLRHALLQLWRVGTHPTHRPTVEDEARHLFSLLTDPILSELVQLRREGHRVRLRTWVGGDKDGHPGVGAQETQASLELSRTRLLAFARLHGTEPVLRDAALAGPRSLVRAARELAAEVEALADLRPGDGGRIRALHRHTASLEGRYRRTIGGPHPALQRLTLLLELFPGLVVPLELREERGLFGPDRPIAAMLRHIAKVAAGGEVRWYARGLVVSMTTEAQDLREAAQLLQVTLGRPAMPVIPLFELPEVLERADAIVREAWKDRTFRDAALRFGGGHLEVMLGYSDTAKRMGVLACKLAIHDAMHRLCAWGRAEKTKVVFFHGSGGSVGRGGGTLSEQAATWPPEAAGLIKKTLQGEMVERTLSSPEILRRQVERLAVLQARPPGSRRPSRLARRLGKLAAQSYREAVGEEEFRALLGAATPYNRLDVLRIGSRPARRGGGAKRVGLEALRAIPWVLCWTQTRYLLHAWIGVGRAWRQVRNEVGIDQRLARALKRDPLLRSYVRLLGFTLAKTEPPIWEAYAKALGAPSARRQLQALEEDRLAALDLARRASPGGALLPDRPWLLESIRLRAPMIHPLNLLQIDLLKAPRLSRRQEDLLRETVTGVALGMLTTG